jgi:hypothetical protein
MVLGDKRAAPVPQAAAHEESVQRAQAHRQLTERLPWRLLAPGADLRRNMVGERIEHELASSTRTPEVTHPELLHYSAGVAGNEVSQPTRPNSRVMVGHLRSSVSSSLDDHRTMSGRLAAW